jgi:hypothetical protein
MADQEVVKLLEEIRDLQKLHVENYKNALINQLTEKRCSSIAKFSSYTRRISCLIVGAHVVAFPFRALRKV